MAMLVYRIEHPSDELGPYQSVREDSSDMNALAWTAGPGIELQEAHSPWKSEAHPIATFITGWRDGYVCGFHSVRKLKQWFELDFRISMKKYGFVCRVFEVNPDAMCSDSYQIGFDREQAELVETIEIPC